MKLVKEVTVDLWRFVRSEFVGTNNIGHSASATGTAVATSATHEETELTIFPTSLPTSTHVPEWQFETSPASRVVLTPGQPAFILFPRTPCYLRPAVVRDTVLGIFSYATTVEVVAEKENWVHITTSELEGWTERLHLTSRRSDVLPTFIPDEIYDANHPETMKLRTYITDEFGVESLGLPALNCEYVWYRMLQNNTEFYWPPLRPRTPGRWREILRPEPSVHVSKVPMTGAIAEYTDTAGVAQLYFIETVTPEESVTVTGFTGADAGQYTVQTLSKKDWSSLDAKCIIKK